MRKRGRQKRMEKREAERKRTEERGKCLIVINKKGEEEEEGRETGKREGRKR